MKNYFANPLFCLFAGIGLNRVIGFSPIFHTVSRPEYLRPASVQMFSSKGQDKSSKMRSIKSFQPKTENQKAFVDLMRNDAVDIVIAIGPAGTGKTMLACYNAIEALRLGKVNKVVVTRPVVSVDEELGFLPGGLESKMDPWTRPIFDTFRETYTAKEIDKMTEEGVIEIVPLGFMRGRTFKNAWIIADEMQNSSPTQMFMLATRIGEGSKMIITGDLNQSDLNPKSNGLLEIYGKIRRFERNSDLDCVRYVELDREDVQRSRAAKSILTIYDPVPESTKNAGHEVVGVRGFAGEISLAQRRESCKSNQCSVKDNKCEESFTAVGVEARSVPKNNTFPLEYSAYEDDSQFTNEFEYLNQVVTSGINLEEKQPDCFNPPKDWVNVDNDAALIPINHISKHYNNLYKR